MNFLDFEKFTLLKTNETTALPYTVMTKESKKGWIKAPDTKIPDKQSKPKIKLTEGFKRDIHRAFTT